MFFNWGFNNFNIGMPMNIFGGGCCCCRPCWSIFDRQPYMMMPDRPLFMNTPMMPAIGSMPSMLDFMNPVNPFANFSMNNFFPMNNIFSMNNFLSGTTSYKKPTGLSDASFGTIVTKRTKASEPEYGKDKSFKNTGKLDKHFLNRVKQIAKNINCNYKDLLAVMNSESGIKTDKWNGNVAVGLIQFTTPAVNELNKKYNLNLTKDKIAKMSPMEQLDITEKYLKICKSYKFANNAQLTAADLYSIIFLPGRADREVLCQRGEQYYTQNSGLDKNKDGKITKTDLEQHLATKQVEESLFA